MRTVKAFLTGALIAVLVAAACWSTPAGAQQIARIYGTFSGAPIALLATSGGLLRVSMEGGTITSQILALATPTDCSAPSYSFAGDPNTGIGYLAADSFSLCVGGSSVATVAANVTMLTHLLFSSDNTKDIGANGATRPRSIYVGTNGTFGTAIGVGATPGSTGVTISAGGDFTFSGRSVFNSTSNGTANLTNNAVNAGIGLDFATDGVLRVKNRAQSAEATITALQGLFTQDTLGNTVERLVTTTTNDDPTETAIQNKITTTDATVTTIHTFTIPTSTSTLIVCEAVARRTGGAAGAAEDSAAYRLGVVVKNTAGTVAEIAAENVIIYGESQAAWDFTASPTGATELIRVTGAASNNISWVTTCRSYPISS